MTMKKNKVERSCALCEHGEEIFCGEWCICKKKGVTSPTDSCSRFQFDPLKVKISVRKIPQFQLPPDCLKP